MPWHTPEELREEIEPILAEHNPAKKTDHRGIDQRATLDEIIFRLGTASCGTAFPGSFPDDSSVHLRTLQRWVELGFWISSGLASWRSARSLRRLIGAHVATLPHRQLLFLLGLPRMSGSSENLMNCFLALVRVAG